MNRYFYRKCSLLIVAVGVAAGAITVGTITSASGQIPIGGSNANVSGVFGPVVPWPIIPLHAVLLPGGRVMSYGTDTNGNQGAQLVYDVWTPALGTGTSAHMVLPNTTSTDIFCSGQSVMTNGLILITGGDLTVDGERNFANNQTTIFNRNTNTIAAGTAMNYPRWYPSLVSQPDGRLVVFGGYQNQTPPLNDPVIPATTPEVYDPATQVWTPLTGASSAAAFGGDVNWYYPRAYVAPGGNIGGNIFVLGADGTMYSMTTAGVGSITQLATTAPYGSDILPTIPFAPGKVLSVRSNQVFVVDFTGAVPVVTQTADLDQYRYYASGTIMADGKVLVNGGSTVPNELTGVAYQVEIWDPATGLWTAGASAAEPRLYHSNALLLTDATVLTGGGGAPGPLTNLNAEIYYPPYLYASSGQPAIRPVITSATPQTLLPGNTINIQVGPTDQISNLTFVRTGSATHDNNLEQRFINLSFTQNGQQLTTVLPSDPTVLVPGYYMLFAFNSAGVPSTAQVLLVDPAQPQSEYVVTSGYNCPQGVYNYPAVTLNETSGDMNVVVIGWDGNGNTINSVTDSQGNAYTLAVPVVRYPASGSPAVSQAMYYTPHVKAGANTVTVTFAGPANYPDLRVLELHGVDAAGVNASAGGSGTATSSGSIHPTTPGLIISAVTTSGGVNSVAGGWNLVVETNPDSDTVATYPGASYPGGTAFSDGATLGAGSPVWVSQMLNTNDTAP
jgi:hypothetical protein